MVQHTVALFLAVVFNATANLLLKFAARDLAQAGPLFEHGLVGAVKSVLTSGRFIAGLAFFALNVPLYFFALQKFKVSLAYPIMIGGGFAIIVAVAGFSGLAERMSSVQWLGVTLILLGVIVVSSGVKG